MHIARRKRDIHITNLNSTDFPPQLHIANMKYDSPMW